MHEDIFLDNIFSPGHLALQLAFGLAKKNIEVTFISPKMGMESALRFIGASLRDAPTIKFLNTDLSLFEQELNLRGYGYLELLKKHPLTFITLARQIQTELVEKTYRMANTGDFDVVHVYACEEEIPIVMSSLCKKPIVFTHHEPFNYLAKYRSIFPKHKDKNWISISCSQRKSMPLDTNWIGNIYHGIDCKKIDPELKNNQTYFAYFGRIIEPKGVHLAIAACKKAGVKLKIAGKHYGDFNSDNYWKGIIEPQLNENIIYEGFIKNDSDKYNFLKNAKALIVPSTWDEPFGMVLIEALACGTPVIGLNSGAIPEIIDDNRNGYLIKKIFNTDKELDQRKTVDLLSQKLQTIKNIDRRICRTSVEEKFTQEKMIDDHIAIYNKLFII